MSWRLSRILVPSTLACIGLGLGVLLFAEARAEEKPSGGEQGGGAKAILAKLGFPEGSVEKIMAGSFVEHSLKPTSKRELSLALAFVVDSSPSEFAGQLDHAMAIRDDPDTIAFGEIHGEGSAGDFQALQLDEKTSRRWLHAEAGEDFNLSSEEIAALRALRGRLGDSASVAGSVTEAVRKILLGRYRAYRASGLAGIAPYQRGSGDSRDAGGELRRASQAAVARGVFSPVLARVLIDYPKAPAAGLKEDFYWLHFRAHGEPVLILTHRLSMPEEGGYASVQRQFYVSGGYDVEQSLAILVPDSGRSVVSYTNATFTDQLDGFGGAMRRSIGGKVLAKQLRGLYETIAKNVADSK